MAHFKRDLFAGVFALLFGLFIFIVSFTIGKVNLAGVGPDYLPRAVGIYIIGLSTIMLVTTVVNHFLKGSVHTGENASAPSFDVRTLLLTVLLLIAYVALLVPVGFILVSALFLFGQMFILAPDGQRKIPLFVILSLVIPAIVYVLFVNVFSLMLPSGILG